MENKMPDLIGETIGEYQIVEKIGKGGMADVYRAYQPSLNRDVAVKVLPAYYAQQDETFLPRFQNEAQAIANLRHPNILMVMSYGEHQDIPYIVMEYVQAGTLKDYMQNELSLAEILEIIRQVGSALDYAHEKGVIHRDVKPSNILMPKPDWALLTDFGLARMVGGSNLTQSGMTVGTPSYMSPEQGSGKKVDTRSDIYSLGIILYEMVVGELPYQAETPMAVVVKHIVDPLPIPRARNPLVPEDLQKVILKSLAKSPADRYQTAKDMVSDLEKVVVDFETKFGAGAVLADGASTILFEDLQPPAEEKTEQTEIPTAVETSSVPAQTASGSQTAAPAAGKPFNWKLAAIIGGIVVVVGIVLIAAFFGGFALLSRMNQQPPPTLVPPPTQPAQAPPPTQQTPPAQQPPSGAENAPPTLPASDGQLPPSGQILQGSPGDMLYQDDFSDPNSGWDRYSDADGSTDYVNGGYHISVANSDYSWWANPGLTFLAAAINVQIELVSGTQDNSFGVICGYQDTENFYVTVISSDGYYGFMKNSGGSLDWIGEEMQLSDAIILGGDKNVLHIDCLKDQIALGVNGQFIDKVTGIELLPGDIGFWGETFDGQAAEFRFDNLRVTMPQGPQQ